MIAKPYTAPAPSDPARQPGWQARKQMAFHLDLAFVKRDDTFLFHGLRIEHDGQVEEIDHVVLHRFGLTLIESGSVTGKLAVGPRGRLTREIPGAAPQPLPSPVERVREQAQALFRLLNAHRDGRRRSRPLDDGCFTVLVAIADRGAIRFADSPPPEMVRADRINEALHAHLAPQPDLRRFGTFIRFMRAGRTPSDGVRAFGGAEMRSLHGLLLAYHRPRFSPAAAR